jgi:cyclopropane-fatty-acyl-phospholipid synthase
MKNEDVRVFAVPTLPSEAAPARSTPLDRWVLKRIQQVVASARLRFVLWDGYEIQSAAGPPVASLVIKNRATLFAWLRNPELNFGEAYMFGAVEVHGDLVATLEEIYRAFGLPTPWISWWRRHTNGPQMARQNVHHHYDLGNEFYQLWLDRELVYTCACFPTADATLEEAQLAKMDLVCRKLHLQPGERVIEAGCGWGSLALFMARRYGVTVRAYNVSTEQIAYARRRADQEGLADRVSFIEDDYRTIEGECDAFVSVGMLEHVGLPDYASLGEVMDRSLTDAGRGLLHFIGRNRPAPLNAWIRRRIFPGAYTPTLREVFEGVIEPGGFSVLDVENLRLHYAKTLEHWLERFERRSEDVRQMFDDTFVRAWRLYLAGSQVSFLTGSLQLFQVVFARGSTNAIPWRRVDG